MDDKAPLTLRGRNPDVLTCIANLSSDEVFTPPILANQMLDSLANVWAKDHEGENLWSNPTVRFLDPCAKSGVFLREITTRLVQGLKDHIPDLQNRVDHILTNQVFGIGITKLTAMLSRRSVYCSKYANGPHSIARSFVTEAGNIWFERMEHTWNGTKCKFCDAPQAIFDRGTERENHAYAFIHTDSIQAHIAELFGGPMQFDVIIGNPPYQMKGGAGGSSDASIYHLFIEQAKKLEPKYISMVVPARWLAGGRGLDEFRREMLSSHHLVTLVDYPVSKEVFPGVEVKGGICYFLWSKAYNGPCNVVTIRGKETNSSKRNLDDFDVYIRYETSANILRKVLQKGEQAITNILTADTPFGIPTNYQKYHTEQKDGDVALYMVREGKRSIVYVPRQVITKNTQLIEKWKVLIPKAGSDGGQKIPDAVLGKPWISAPPAVCTQSFLAFWVNSEEEAISLASYYRTKFFRHLVSLRKITQDALKPMYQWVPLQKWDQLWTDAELYQKYGLSGEEISFIEAMIRPMDEVHD